tara:strand:+ start:1133 stop:1243 length:111 start_codon:yes stop_codon:yes gene_type:complete
MMERFAIMANVDYRYSLISGIYEEITCGRAIQEVTG